MNGQVAIYLRNEQIIVVPQAGGGGYSYDVEPVHVLPAETDAEALNDVIKEALKVSRQAKNLPVQVDTKAFRSPALEKVGVRSLRAFYHNAAYSYLYEEGTKLMMLKFVPASDGRGFELSDEAPVQIGDATTTGSTVLGYLRSAPRMP